jgi:hypothetical protein
MPRLWRWRGRGRAECRRIRTEHGPKVSVRLATVTHDARGANIAPRSRIEHITKNEIACARPRRDCDRPTPPRRGLSLPARYSARQLPSSSLQSRAWTTSAGPRV